MSTGSSVINSRIKKKMPLVWRRRQCNSCSKIYTTHEIPNYDQITLVDTGGAKTGFSRPKLYVSVYKACETLTGAPETADALTDTITAQMLQIDEDKRTTELLQDIVCKTLKRFDASAFVRYISARTSLSSSRELKRALKFYQ